jgi:quercetin dioxygenase-like cupin family protein
MMDRAHHKVVVSAESSAALLKSKSVMTDCRTQTNKDHVTHEEAALFPALTIMDLSQAASSVTQTYKNFVLSNVNNHCMRIAVMQGEFPWHHHPHSDECFLVLEGLLEIDLADGRTFRLKPGEAFTIPAGLVHRTRAQERTVNLCFEDRAAYTDTVFCGKQPPGRDGATSVARDKGQ